MNGLRRAFHLRLVKAATRGRSAAVSLVILALTGAARARAQTANSVVVEPGDAAVTGFSGAPPPARSRPAIDPGGENIHRPRWPLAERFRSSGFAGPALAQLVRTPKSFYVMAQRDRPGLRRDPGRASPPNIYAAAIRPTACRSSRPGRTEYPSMSASGQAGADFMPGSVGRAAPRADLVRSGNRRRHRRGPPVRRCAGHGRAKNSGAALGGLAL